MTKRRFWAQCIVALFLLAGMLSCGGGGSSTPAAAPACTSTQWTYMVYMGADNNLSDAGLADLKEMEKVGSSSCVKIVVQAEFSPQYSSNISASLTGRVLVEKGVDSVNAGSLVGTGVVDMASPAALTSFISWAKATYPAAHYALVVWDHGAGWKAKKISSPARGAVQDATSGNFMSLPDLAKGVRDANVPLDIINFDACLMAMYEVAYEFTGLTDYMVFSEQTEPGNGDPYDTILAALAATPTMSSRTLASTIVDKYNAFYVPDTRNETTKSAIDMAQLSQLDAKIIALSAALATDTSTKAVVQAAQANTQNYVYPANHDIYDFCSYLASRVSGTAKTVCGQIMTLMPSIVINNKYTGTSVNKSHGLAIYLPKADETSATDLTEYGKLKCNLTTRASAGGTWGSYVESLLGASALQTYVSGNFALYLYWTKPDGTYCNADLDLYVVEPDGYAYAPWNGQTTPNGFFSQESTQSGLSEEYYLANELVMPGDYLFLVNYYQDGATCTKAYAHVLVQDPVTVGGTWTELPGSPLSLDLTTPPGPMPIPTPCTTYACFNTYSDWWYLGGTTRSINSSAGLFPLDLPFNTRNSNFIFRNQRGAALQGLTR